LPSEAGQTQNPILKIIKAKKAEDMTQVVEHLLSKTLSSNISTAKNKKS
jgi:hypothetical protein